MAQVKLTLSAEKEVVEEAKRIAREKNTSVSALFARYIKGISDLQRSEGTFGPITSKASGMISLPKGKSGEKLLEDALWERYGKKE